MPVVVFQSYFSWLKRRSLLGIVMIVITAATKQEMDGISRCLKKKQRILDVCCEARLNTYKDKEVLTIQTGIGRNRAESTIESILTSYQPSAILSLGFAGALIPDLKIGDLVICASVVSEDETYGTSVNPYYADEYLLNCSVKALDGNGLKWLRGTGVTISKLASDAKGKNGLRDRIRAEVCEMEDYWIARAASGYGIPFLAVRVIYDEIDTVLPEYNRMVDRHSNVKLDRTMIYVLTHPGQLLNMWAAYRNYCRTKESLSIFTENFLDSL